MEVGTIEIHEQLIVLLKERFREELGVSIENASDSLFTQSKIDLFKHKVYAFGEIHIKEDIKPNSVKKKFERALIFEAGSTGGVTIEQYDEICCFLLHKILIDCVKDYSSGTIIRTVYSLADSRRIGKAVKKHSSGSVSNFQIKNEDLKTQIDGVVCLNKTFWNAQKPINSKQQLDLVNRYYIYIDTNQIANAVAIEKFIVEPQEMFSVIDSEKNVEQKTFNQILEQSNSEAFSLIKILGEGGIGKSTFLYWIGKNYFHNYNIFLLKKIYSNTTELLIVECSKILKFNSNPLIFLIDDIAEYGKSKQVIDLIEKIKQNLTPTLQVIFIVAERKARYNAQIGYKTLDTHFSGNVQQLNFIPPDRKEIFFKIYDILSEKNSQLDDPNSKQAAENVFLDENILSISESIFKLLFFLKLKENIFYEFDWDDWDIFIKNNPEYRSLENLFIAVTCFYQFGIMLPITFQSASMQGINRITIRKAINAFGIETSPIRLIEEEDGNTKLFLKHEYVATWFLYDEDRKSLVKDFFKDFISSVNSKESGWLLRQFRKILKSQEYLASGFQEILNEDKYISLIDDYVSVPGTIDIERAKMQMEKGIILLQRGDVEQAKVIFEWIAATDKKNNHARDQLSKIYLKSSTTYQQAFDKYLEIFQNGGHYALVQIYKMLRICKKNSVSIQYEDHFDFASENIFAIADKLTSYDYHEAIKEFILNNELDLAENLLKRIERHENITANCYNLLANAFIYSNKTIEKKDDYFNKAIEINTTLNPKEKNPQYTIDYAVFLYRIRKFPKSLQVIKVFIAEFDDLLKERIENTYWNNVRSTKKLFFADIPAKDSLYDLEQFLLKQCKEAASLISLKQTNIDNIIKGYLILQTVKYHSKILLPNVFNNASKLMAYCYMQNAEKKWNNLSTTENRFIAEKLYDQLLNVGYNLDKNDCANLLKNLLNYKDKEKSRKALRLCNSILENSKYKKFSIFYRYRGNSKKYLEDYNGAMMDYQTALIKCTRGNSETEKDYINDKCYLLNNIALIICDCFEIRRPFKKYTLGYALDCCIQSIELRPRLPILQDTKQRIERLM